MASSNASSLSSERSASRARTMYDGDWGSSGTGVGGSFHPGIESGSVIAQESTYEQPFRISRTIQAGDLTQQLSVPWQADFRLCSQIWWPSARPGSVIVEEGGTFRAQEWTRGVQSNRQMVDDWSKLGFVIRESNSPLRYTEQERTLGALASFRRS